MGLKSLWKYLDERGVDVENIKSSIKDIVIKTFLSAENVLLDMAKGNVANKYQCYELFGFDILLDANLKPWLLEVNISPSLHSSSSLDLSVKVQYFCLFFSSLLCFYNRSKTKSHII